MSRFVAIVYRNAQAYAPGAKHVGLGVNAMHTVKGLTAAGVDCEAYSAHEIDDLFKVLDPLPPDSVVVIEALWVVTENVYKLLARYPRMDFVVRCHSQIGFLQVEPAAVKLVREQVAVQDHNRRFHLSGNSPRFTDVVVQGYRNHCAYLPNLYPVDRAARKPAPHSQHRVLRVGSFGALRHLKMHLTAASAALIAANRMGRDLEFHMTVGRSEGGGPVLQAIRYLFDGLPSVKLVENPWAPWSEFRRIVAHMDLCLQVSATESFNLVTADAMAEGTPSVVGPAIDWAPRDWVADIDDPGDIAQKIVHVANDPRAGERGITALEAFTSGATKEWLSFLAKLEPAKRS